MRMNPDESFEEVSTLPHRTAIDSNLSFKDKLKIIDGLVFREVTSDTVSSVAILGRRVIRQYASEFILPDDTKISIRRHESFSPSDGEDTVTLSLSVAMRLGPYEMSLINPKTLEPDLSTDSGAATSMSGTSVESLNEAREIDLYSNKIDSKRHGRHSKRPPGLQMIDYMDDDPWAVAILTTDSRSNADLLRQLETGCRRDPEAYRMERVQRKRNLETIVNLQSQPIVRSIGLSRVNSETDSILTACTNVDDSDELNFSD